MRAKRDEKEDDVDDVDDVEGSEEEDVGRIRRSAGRSVEECDDTAVMRSSGILDVL